MPLKVKHTSKCTIKFAYTKDYNLNIIEKYSRFIEKLLLIQTNKAIMVAYCIGCPPKNVHHFLNLYEN